MNFSQWTKSSTDYGRKLLNSGLEGARSGEEEFLSGNPISPLLNESARHSVTAAALGGKHRIARRPVYESQVRKPGYCLRGLWSRRRLWCRSPLGRSSLWSQCDFRGLEEHREGTRRTLAGKASHRLRVEQV